MTNTGNWIAMLAGGAGLLWLISKRRAASSAESAPSASINIPAASSTPDILSYNLPAWQKPELILPTTSVVSPMAGTGTDLAPLQVMRPIAVSGPFSGTSAGGAGGCCETSCGCTKPGILAANQDQLLAQMASAQPDLSGRMLANLLTAFPSSTIRGNL
jgi:hypothetical protein